MRRVIQMLVLAVLVGASGAKADAAKVGKTRVSANGVYGIRMILLEPGKCRLETVKEREVVWQLDKCLGDLEDLYFINNEGTRVWLLRPVPEIPPHKKNQKDAAVFEAVVALLYDKEGKVLSRRKLVEFIGGKKGGGRLIRKLDYHFKWLEGVADMGGKGPRVTDANEVEFETVDSKTHRLKF